MKLYELKIYMHYYIRQITLKYDFITLDKNKTSESSRRDKKGNVIRLSWNHGYGKPDKKTKNTAYYYLWKDIGIQSFEEFKGKDDWGERYIDIWYRNNKSEINE